MIDLYFWPTPNGLKARLGLEEMGVDYTLHRVDLGKGEQHAPDYLKISPNGKIPAIVDHAPADGGPPLAMFESGAFLLYLADKTGRLIANDLRGRQETVQWLFWQMASLGPMAGQAGHFRVFAPEVVPYGVERYTREVTRLYGVLDRQLDGRDFIAGAFSIADVACYPWIVPHEAHGQVLADFPNLSRWFAAIAARPATQKVYAGVKATYTRDRATLTEAERAVLFNPVPAAAPHRAKDAASSGPASHPPSRG